MQNGTEACPQKSVKERMLEQAFVRAMNKVIGGKDAFMEKLLANIDKCLSEKVYDFSLEEIDEKVSSEIELFRERRQRLKEKAAMDSLRIDRIKDLKEFFRNSDIPLEKFDGDLFGRLIEKIKVTSLVEVREVLV